MLQKLNIERPDLDILVVTGDIVGHTFSQDVKANFSEKLYETLLEVHQNFSILAAKYLPNTIVLPTFGNNDFKFHYQTPLQDNKKPFFEEIFEFWFQNHPANSKMLNLPLIKSTFMMGGFYRVNLPQSSANVSVLAMNSISYSTKNLNVNGDQDM
jgi:hypothetical protein